jgi:hypothetical protein
MIIRKANDADSKALIALTSVTPMKGNISLRIDRKPDFFALLKERGDFIVWVATDEGGNVVGSFSTALQNFVLANEICQVYYVGDLKVHPSFSKTTIAYRLVKSMYTYLKQSGADLLLCTAAAENEAVFPFLKGRAGIPSFLLTCTFNIYQLLPKHFLQNDGVVWNSDNCALHSFYNNYLKRYHIHPTITCLDNCINIFIEEKGHIKAALSLYDPGSLKQNVVLDYPLYLSALLQLLRSVKLFLPLPPLPKKGEALRLLYIRYYGFEAGAEASFLTLIHTARSYAFNHNFHFLTIAVDDKDGILKKFIKPMSCFNFRSHQFITSLKGNNELLHTIRDHLNYEDYSLV